MLSSASTVNAKPALPPAAPAPAPQAAMPGVASFANYLSLQAAPAVTPPPTAAPPRRRARQRQSKPVHAAWQ